MTVNKSTTSTKTKKKSATANSASTSSSSVTKSKTSKVTSSSSTSQEVLTNTTGALSQCSSGSTLQIADVSHLPVNASVVTYTVTEKLPAETGEKITTYSETGATSTEYVHFISSDTSNTQQTSNIQQISSILNRSTSNLSTLTDDSSATYTVLEPKEEIKYVGKNDAAWNGKFIYETPTSKKDSNIANVKNDGTVFEEHVTSSSKQQSSSTQKSSSSSYAIEIVDGKERIIDEKHHKSGYSKASSKEEDFSSKHGTNITPETHYLEKGKTTSSVYNTDVPELTDPKTSTAEYGKELHKIGDIETKSSYKTKDKELLSKPSTQPLEDSSTKRKSDTNWDGTFVLEKADARSNKVKQTASDSRNFFGSDTKSSATSRNVDVSSSKVIKGPTSTTTTTTTTYYDSSGNVIKTDSHVDNKITEGNQFSNVDDSSSTKTYYVGEHIDKTNIHSKDYVTESNDDASSSKTYYVGETSILDDRHKSDMTDKRNEMKSTTKNFYSTDDVYDDVNLNKTYIIDDTTKRRTAQTTTDSRNFYGHGMDSSGTMVKNVYDTGAIQNTIGTKGRVIKDDTLDTTDVIYSNERNYGKTGWNGKFTYETPQTPKGEPTDKKSTPTTKTAKPRKSTGSPTRKPGTKPQDVSKEFIDSEIIVDYQGQVTDVKTAIQKDSKTFIDQESAVGRDVFDVDRRGPRPQKHPVTDSNVIDTYETSTNISNYKTSTVKDTQTFVENQTISDGPRKPYLTSDGKTPKQPKDLIERQPDTKTVIEAYETVTNKSDFQTTVVKDSQTFVDNQSTTEHYTTTDKYDSTIDGPRRMRPGKPGDKKDYPISETPKRPIKDTKPDQLFSKDVRNYDIIESYKNTDVKTSVTEDFRSETILDEKNITENYVFTDRKNIKDDKTIRDIKNIDVVDRVHIDETIVDIKDIVSFNDILL